MIDSNVVGALVVGALGVGFLLVGPGLSKDSVNTLGVVVVVLIVLAVVYFSGGVTP